MKKVKIGNRTGLVSSIIPHRNGAFPVWFDDGGQVEFVKECNVEFIQTK